MLHQGSCHCGKVSFEVEANLEQVIECNCSYCQQKGLLLTFAPREAMTIKSGEDNLSTYQFNKHVIRHRFCTTCGSQPFGEGASPKGDAMVAINVRCLEGIDLAGLTIVPHDGRSV